MYNPITLLIFSLAIINFQSLFKVLNTYFKTAIQRHSSNIFFLRKELHLNLKDYTKVIESRPHSFRRTPQLRVKRK